MTPHFTDEDSETQRGLGSSKVPESELEKERVPEAPFPRPKAALSTHSPVVPFLS